MTSPQAEAAHRLKVLADLLEAHAQFYDDIGYHVDGDTEVADELEAASEHLWVAMDRLRDMAALKGEHSPIDKETTMNGDSEDLRRMDERVVVDSPRDDLEPLLDEVERMREGYERLLEDNRKLAEEVGRNAVAVVGLQAENERLRAALRQIAEYDSDDPIFYVDIARAALEEA